MSPPLQEIEPFSPVPPVSFTEAINSLRIPQEWLKYGVINAVEAALHKLSPSANPTRIEHLFAHHHYIRTIYMPKGTLIVSKHHKTMHPFTVTKGCVGIYQEVNGVVDTRMPKMIHVGGEGEHFACLTEPGTRRLLFCHEDTVWTTMHPTSLTTVEEVEAAIILPDTNPLLK